MSMDLGLQLLKVKYMQDIMEKQHKILYILLKQVCHKFEVSNLRNAFTSYQLKQVCIHHDAKCQVETEKSLDCLENITNNMIKHCTEKYLPSVLNKDVDLFKAFDFSNERGWHFKLHFLIALRLICQRSRNIYNIEEFEAVLNESIKQSVQKFADYDAIGINLNIPFDKLPSLDPTKENRLYCPICDEKTKYRQYEYYTQ